MNLNPLKSIFAFNKQAGLLEAGYNDERECAFPIEEALEGFKDIPCVAKQLSIYGCKPVEHTPKDVSRQVVSLALETQGNEDVPDVDRLDKHLDIIVFSLGSIYKLGLSPQQAMKALGIVAQANLQKLHVGQDAEGKQQKPDNFVGPEAQLQKILDER